MVNKAIRSAREEQQELEALHRLDEECVHQQRAGNYLKAFDCMERALVLRRHFFGVESDEVVQACRALAEMCNLLAMSFLQQDNFTVTIDLLKKAEILTQRHHAAERATTLNNLACYYRRLGKLHAAMTNLKRALELEKRLQNLRNAADTQLNMCAVLSQLGKHQEALEHAQEALITLQEEFFQGKHSDTTTGDDSAGSSTTASSRLDRLSVMCIAYHNIGVEQEFLKEYAESVTSYKKGVGVAEQYLGVDHSITTTIRNSYLAAKRTMAAKASARSRASASSSRDTSMATKSPGKATTRLLQSPRSGSMRLPSPLTKEKERHNIPQIPTPRSIIADALSRAPLSALPPLELEGSASVKKTGKKKSMGSRDSGESLSPSDPFFSPRFRFGEDSTGIRTKKLAQSDSPGEIEAGKPRAEDKKIASDLAAEPESGSTRADSGRKSTSTARTEDSERKGSKASQTKRSLGEVDAADGGTASAGPDGSTTAAPVRSARIVQAPGSAQIDPSKVSSRAIYKEMEASVVPPSDGPSAASARAADDTAITSDLVARRDEAEDPQVSIPATGPTIAVEMKEGPAFEVALAPTSESPGTAELKSAQSPQQLPPPADVDVVVEASQPMEEEGHAKECEVDGRKVQEQEQVQDPSQMSAQVQNVNESIVEQDAEAEDESAQQPVQEHESAPEAVATPRPVSAIELPVDDRIAVPENPEVATEEMHAQEKPDPEVSNEAAEEELAPEDPLIPEKAEIDADEPAAPATLVSEETPDISAASLDDAYAAAISGEDTSEPDDQLHITKMDDTLANVEVEQSEPPETSRASEGERHEMALEAQVDNSPVVETSPGVHDEENLLVTVDDTSELASNIEQQPEEFVMASGDAEEEEIPTATEVTPTAVEDPNPVGVANSELPTDGVVSTEAMDEESVRPVMLGVDDEETHHVDEILAVEVEQPTQDLGEEIPDPAVDTSTHHESDHHDKPPEDIETDNTWSESVVEDQSQSLPPSDEGHEDARWHSPEDDQDEEASIGVEADIHDHDAAMDVEVEQPAHNMEELHSGEDNGDGHDNYEESLSSFAAPALATDTKTSDDEIGHDALAGEAGKVIEYPQTTFEPSEPSEEYAVASPLAELEHVEDAADPGEGYTYDWNYAEQPEHASVDDPDGGAVLDGQAVSETGLAYAYETAEDNPEVDTAVDSTDYSSYYRADGTPIVPHDTEHYSEAHTGSSCTVETTEYVQYSEEYHQNGNTDRAAHQDTASWAEGVQEPPEATIKHDEQH